MDGGLGMALVVAFVAFVSIRAVILFPAKFPLPFFRIFLSFKVLLQTGLPGE